MAKLSKQECKAFSRIQDLKIEPLPLSAEDRFVAPTLEARARYVRFVS